MPITSSDMAAIFVPNMPSESLVLSCEAYMAFRAIKYRARVQWKKDLIVKFITYSYVGTLGNLSIS